MFESIYKSYNFQTANLNKKQEYGREIHGGEKNKRERMIPMDAKKGKERKTHDTRYRRSKWKLETRIKDEAVQ